MRQIKSGTYTGLALQMARKKMFSSRSGRRSSTNSVAILITDGSARDYSIALKESVALKKMGVKIMIVGLGKRGTVKTFVSQLRKLSSYPWKDHVFTLQFNQLVGIQKLLAQKTCGCKSSISLFMSVYVF